MSTLNSSADRPSFSLFKAYIWWSIWPPSLLFKAIPHWDDLSALIWLFRCGRAPRFDLSTYLNKEDQADKRTSKVRLESRELKRSSDLFLLVYFGFNNSDLDYPILYKMQTESSAGAPQPSSFEQISDPDIDEIKRSFQVREMYMVMKSLI